ncbi:hypothetical protein pipiens_004551 [Culex pipiens pipiens]|uniref:Uncharacterized protein n=1 Tax=Culex pipiens pipiens TaxID=38569 RepID=A0ABD1CHX7_CULPP
MQSSHRSKGQLDSHPIASKYCTKYPHFLITIPVCGAATSRCSPRPSEETGRTARVVVFFAAERLSKPDSCHAGSTEDLVVPKRVGPAAKGNVAKAVTPRMFWKLLPPDPTEKFSPSREITPSSLKLRIHNRLYENLQLLPPTTDVVGSRLKAALVCRMFGRCSEGQRTNGDI